MFSLGIALVCFLGIYLMLRVSTKLMTVEPERLESKLVIRKYGHLFESLNAKSKSALSYNLVFVIRRIAMCLLFLFVQSVPSF